MGQVTYMILRGLPIEYLGRDMKSPPSHVICENRFFIEKSLKNRKIAKFTSKEIERSHVTTKNVDFWSLGII